MKAPSLLLVAAATCSFGAAIQAREESFSEQLLDTLESFPSSDPIVSELSAAIRNSSALLDQAPSQNSAISARASTFQAQVACQLLRYILPDSYTDATTNQTNYVTLRDKNWSSNCDLPAACFITPEHPIQVAVALQVISRVQSNFAVRSGGHNPNPGFAGIGQDGVTIDTQRFSHLSLSADKSYATVGAGLRFGPVQEYLDSQGVAVVSGRNKYVGVSGLLLGGGHPIINSLTGLAADNIKSMEVVLSDFRVVTASRTENSDLFRALKGGGNNFGIVTKFELYTKMPRNLWYRNAIYAASDAKAVFQALAEVQNNMEEDPKAGIQMTCSPDGFTVAFVYGEPTNDPAVFAPFSKLVPTSERTPPINGTTLEFIQLQSPPQPEASRDTVGVTTIPDADLYLDLYNQYLTINAANNGTSAAFLLVIQTLGAAAVRVAECNGGNALGTSERALTLWNPISTWTDPADGNKVHNVLTQIGNYIKDQSQAKNLYDPLIFANIAAHDQKVLASYGSQNLNFLLGVSQKYDRSSTFQRLQNGGFLVSRS
ncbi:FAD-binding domain-containing protein [Daldinia caldariorum]|uniref:FAD-binding domain-containing protein n=1 Tax=Daldinia caldariorum TaxID=326644 RepID=UPI00200898F2|nr:FAD-binding domain-containing protein [Daldinia caldariorum]KAI1468197.1 FAD-binding domain-containing protein [Daldinia caldariorum]